MPLVLRISLAGMSALVGLVACAAEGGGIGIARGYNVVAVPLGDRRPAPAFGGESLRPGPPLTQEILAGKVGVVNFWGSWCGPCRREQGRLEALWKEYGPRGVQFLGINTRRDQRAAALAFLEEFGVTYPSIYNPDSRIAFRLGVRFMPTTLVIDRNGRVGARIIGAVATDVDLRKILDAELAS